MWFVFVGVGLAVLVACGIYVRRRVAGALTLLGVRDRRVRLARWLIVWLLFGFPLLAFVTIATSLLLGSATVPRFDGIVASWLLVFPWAWSALVAVQSVPWLVANDVVHLIARRRRGATTAARRRA